MLAFRHVADTRPCPVLRCYRMNLKCLSGEPARLVLLLRAPRKDETVCPLGLGLPARPPHLGIIIGDCIPAPLRMKPVRGGPSQPLCPTSGRSECRTNPCWSAGSAGLWPVPEVGQTAEAWSTACTPNRGAGEDARAPKVMCLGMAASLKAHTHEVFFLWEGLGAPPDLRRTLVLSASTRALASGVRGCQPRGKTNNRAGEWASRTRAGRGPAARSRRRPVIGYDSGCDQFQIQ